MHREVLRPAGIDRPRFFGEGHGLDGDVTCLVFEYIATQASRESALRERALCLASRWIGLSHRQMVGSAGKGVPLVVYDRGHYTTIVERADEFSQTGQVEFPLLPSVFSAFREICVDELLAQPTTIIHGDFFSDNVLLVDGSVLPIDWELTAIGPGVVDFGSLTDRWPEVTVAACAREYQRARWPDGTPESFGRDVDLARLYLCLRYMSVSHEFTMHEKRRWRFEAACSLAGKLGLL